MMNLHLIAGPEWLFFPETPPLEALAGSIGPEVNLAPLAWLAPDLIYADSLLEDPIRKGNSLLLSLHAGFGGDHDPMVVLPGLLGSPAPSAASILGRHLISSGLIKTLHLHTFAAPPVVMTSEVSSTTLEQEALATTERRLKTSAAEGTEVATHLHALDPELDAHDAMWRNVLARELAGQSQSHLQGRSLQSNMSDLTQAFSELLRQWRGVGITIEPALSRDRLEALVEKSMEILLARPPTP